MSVSLYFVGRHVLGVGASVGVEVGARVGLPVGLGVGAGVGHACSLQSRDSVVLPHADPPSRGS
jgi:hypothetical protein